jgi:hypothetical protein
MARSKNGVVVVLGSDILSLAELHRRQAEAIAVNSNLQDVVTPRLEMTPIEYLVTSFGHFLSPWHNATFPYFGEGNFDTPDLDEAIWSGVIETRYFRPGGVGFDGVISKRETESPAWWQHGWLGSYVFPAAPFDGRLFYRFEVRTRVHVEIATPELLRFYIDVAARSDAFDDSLLEWNSVGSPVAVPLQATPVDVDLTTRVAGGIDVRTGVRSALVVSYDSVASVGAQYGYILFGGEMQAILTETSESESPSIGSLRYRFEPEWWIQATEAYIDDPATLEIRP